MAQQQQQQSGMMFDPQTYVPVSHFASASRHVTAGGGVRPLVAPVTVFGPDGQERHLNADAPTFTMRAGGAGGDDTNSGAGEKGPPVNHLMNPSYVAPTELYDDIVFDGCLHDCRALTSRVHHFCEVRESMM